MSGNSAAEKMPEFDYESESDTLTIWGGGPAGGGGFDITRGVLIVFFDYDHATPVGLMLCGAAKLLGPHLPIKSIANAEPASYRDKIDLKIDYAAANDTLWMSNSRPADVAYPIIDDAVIVYFEAGSENITEEDGKIPSGVMVYDAVKRIEPAILTDLAELATAKGGA
jgi:hypothetical protein